jgi:biotin operon repressor
MAKNSLLEILIESLPTDKESAVTQDYLSQAVGVSRRNIRQLVQQARKEGYGVCSSPYRGYWLSTEPADIMETVSILNAQAKTIIDTVDSMYKILENN